MNLLVQLGQKAFFRLNDLKITISYTIPFYMSKIKVKIWFYGLLRNFPGLVAPAKAPPFGQLQVFVVSLIVDYLHCPGEEALSLLRAPGLGYDPDNGLGV